MISKIGVSPVFTSRVNIVGLAIDHDAKETCYKMLPEIRQLKNNGNDDDVTFMPKEYDIHGVSTFKGDMIMKVTEKNDDGYRAAVSYVVSPGHVISAYDSCKKAIATGSGNLGRDLFDVKFSDKTERLAKNVSKKVFVVSDLYGSSIDKMAEYGLPEFIEKVENNGKDDETITILPMHKGYHRMTLNKKNRRGELVSDSYGCSFDSLTTAKRLMDKYKALSACIDTGYYLLIKTETDIPFYLKDYVK